MMLSISDCENRPAPEHQRTSFSTPTARSCSAATSNGGSAFCWLTKEWGKVIKLDLPLSGVTGGEVGEGDPVFPGSLESTDEAPRGNLTVR